MRRLRAVAVAAFTAAVCSTWLAAVGVAALYGWGLWRAPPLPAPMSDGIDARSRELFWRLHAGDVPMRMRRETPLTLVVGLVGDHRFVRGPQVHRIAMIAARSTLQPDHGFRGLAWHHVSWTRWIHVTQHWTAEAAIDHVLSTTLVRGAGRGLRTASLRWYRTTPDELTDAERLAVLVAMDLHAEPACGSHVLRRLRTSAVRLGLDPSDVLSRARARLVTHCATQAVP